MAKRKAKTARPTLAKKLAVSESAGLIQVAQLAPEIEYMFRHALFQDVTYNSVLKKDRRRLHAIVGQVLEQTYPKRADELAATLAFHFQQAGDSDRALRYFDRAVDVAMASY